MFFHEIILFINCVKMSGISNEVVPIINLTNINKDTSTGQEHFTIILYNSYAQAYNEITYFNMFFN
jgi:hypothetical protein